MRKNMLNFAPGNKAICPYCEKLVSTTFAYRYVDVGNSKKYMLAAVCDECNEVAAVPAQ
jgi:hypothetical protein